MKNLFRIIVLFSFVLLAGCGTVCDNTCQKIRSDERIESQRLQVEGLKAQAEIDAKKPTEVRVAEIRKEQEAEDISLGEGIATAGAVAGGVRIFSKMIDSL